MKRIGDYCSDTMLEDEINLMKNDENTEEQWGWLREYGEERLVNLILLIFAIADTIVKKQVWISRLGKTISLTKEANMKVNFCFIGYYSLASFLTLTTWNHERWSEGCNTYIFMNNFLYITNFVCYFGVFNLELQRTIQTKQNDSTLPIN